MALFKRQIEVEVQEEGDEHLRLRGMLTDRRMGTILHQFEVTMLVSVLQGEIKEIEGKAHGIPLEECVRGLDSLEELLGVKIEPGFTDFVKSTVGSNRGCTHLSSLVMNMANTSVQGRGAYVRKHVPDEESARAAMASTAIQLGLIDSCVCWTEDGPIIRRWRGKQER